MMLRKKYASSPAAVIYWSGALRRVHGALRACQSRRRSVGCFPSRVAKQLGISFGTVIILTGAAVLLLWIPIRQMPGLGTVEQCHRAGISGGRHAGRPAAAGVDVGAQCAAGRSDCAERYRYRDVYWRGLWPGPRDGLMTGLHARTGWSLRGIRTAIELSVLLIGWLLGGKFGVGTVIYALSIGPLIQLCLPWFSQPVSRNAVSPPREIVS